MVTGQLVVARFPLAVLGKTVSQSGFCFSNAFRKNRASAWEPGFERAMDLSRKIGFAKCQREILLRENGLLATYRN